jgi:hypothetical protein
MGTVDYMAPEQALSAKSADVRSDIYSLGISLWYLLTGRVAYDGDSVMAKLLAHRDAAIPSLSEAFRRMPQTPVAALSDGDNLMEARGTRTEGASMLAPLGDKLDSMFRKMVAKQPENRYQTMAEVIRDLESCLTRPDLAAISSSGLVSNSGDTQAPASADSETLLQSTSELVAIPSPDQSTTRGGFGSQSPAPASRRNKTILVLLGVIAVVVITVLSVSNWEKATTVQQVGQADPPKEVVPAAVPSQITKDTSDKPAEGVVLSESSKMPFVILRNGVATSRQETLEEAITTSQSQDVIEVHGNGPFPIGSPKPINVDKSRGVFAIKAASGFRPLFVSALSTVESIETNFDISCDSVRFEDIDFVLTGAGGFIFYNAREVAFLRCRCVTTSSALGSLAYFHCGPETTVSFSDCFVASAKREGALTLSGSPARIEMSNSFLIARSVPLALHQAVGTFVQLSHCTLIGSSAIAWAVPETEKQQRVPESAKLSHCLLLGSLHISDQVNWQGVENVYGDSEFGKSGFYLPNNVMLPFDEWVKRPSQPETGSKQVSTKGKGLDELSNSDSAVMFRRVEVYLEELRSLHPDVGVDPAVADASVAKSANSEPSAANAPIGVR